MKQLIFFTDGASRNNGSAEAVASCAYLGTVNGTRTWKGRAFKLRTGTTNNAAELYAILFALQRVNTGNLEISIRTDSRYSEIMVQKLIFGRPLGKAKNPEILAMIGMECNRLRSMNCIISISYVEGHNGIIGNETCDMMCNSIMDSDMLAAEYWWGNGLTEESFLKQPDYIHNISEA